MKNVLIFMGGAAMGSVVTWKLLEKKYVDLANEEIDSVVERFKQKEHELKKQVENKEEYNNIIQESEYKEPEVSKEIKNIEDKLINNPKTSSIKLITIDEFGDKPKYQTKSWTYYANDILTDEIDMVVDNPEEIIGDALNHFDDYEDGDVVYVRNTKQKCDYEILKSEKDFEI